MKKFVLVDAEGKPLDVGAGITMTGKGSSRRPWGTVIVSEDETSVYVRNEGHYKALRNPSDPCRGGKKRKGTAMTPPVRELMAIATAVRLKIPLSVRSRGILQSHLNLFM